jgi:Ca2+-binding RTX toxin-like protein
VATINGDGTDNVLNGTSDADDITGGAGNDTINAGSGNDVIDAGSSSLTPTDLELNWTDEGGDGTNIVGGFTQNTGGINVEIGFTNGGTGTSATVETNAGYVDTGEPFNANSNVSLIGNGTGTAWTTDIEFSAVGGSGFDDSVSNVQFRLQDIDQGGWQDVLTVNAYDADGNPIEVNLTPSGDDSVSGNTVTAGGSATAPTSDQGSVLVEIPGPVARVEIIYENAGTGGQLLYVSDVHFQAVPQDDDQVFGEGGNDTISGGFGDDLLDGGGNNDSIDGGEGYDTLVGGGGRDTLDGGAGNDTLQGDGGRDSLVGGEGDDLLQGGSGFDTLIGGEGADTLEGGNGNDVIIASGGDVVSGGEGGTDTGDELIVDDVASVTFDPLDSENGTVTFNDGSTLTFTGIEQLTVNGGPDGIVSGTNQNDLIDGDFVDENLEQVDNNDGTLGTTGDQDNIQAGLGDDTVFAGQGDDTVTGGPSTTNSASENLSWIAQGDNSNVDVFTQDTGLSNVTVEVRDDGALTQANVDSSTQYVDTGEPFSTTSSLSIGGDGGPDVATVTVSSDTPMQDVSFRLNDIDSGAWQDILSVNAFDADGNSVTVDLTAAGNETITGQTATGGAGNDNQADANGSVLVEIDGPITRFEIIYENGSTGGQVVYVTDVHFTAVETDDDDIYGEQGSDSLDGAAGDDLVFGDVLNIDPADIASGSTGSVTSVTFDNQSPHAVQLAQVDATGTIVPVLTLPAGSSFTAPSTSETNWVILDPDTNDILEVYEAPADGSTQTFASSGQDTISGGDGNDTLSGDFGDDTVDGGDGDDITDGGSGDDVVTGGAGADTLSGGTGDDTLQGGTGDDSLSGGDGNDSLDGDDNADTLEGGAGDDLLSGGSGNDSLDGGSEADSLLGGTGEDTLVGGTGDDTLDGGADADTLQGDAGNDSLDGGDGDDSLQGGADDDTLNGGLGADTLEGGTGDDVLLSAGDATGGAAGATDPSFGDSLVGGEGDDIFFANGSDTVDGSEDAGDTDFDTLNVTDVASIQYQDEFGADVGFVTEQGVVTFNDGSTLQFSNIENVVDLELDGYVEGTTGDDVIDETYTGDPEDDRVDNNDAVLDGEASQDDIILAGGGNDTVTGGAGDDEIYGDTGAIASNPDGSGGSNADGDPWRFEYYDLDPTGNPLTLAQAGFTDNGGRDNTNTLTSSGTSSSITPTDYDTADDYALKFTTELTVTTGGDYTFTTTSDDGSKLFVNGIEVVDNDGHHAAVTESGTITLPPGQHTIEIVYYENNGGNVLSSTISGPDTSDVAVDLESYPALVDPELNSNSGNDSLDGGAGDDIIYGEGGDDTLIGGEGSDTLEGGDDADRIIIGSGDVVDGGEGGNDNDTLVITDAGATVDYDTGNPENGTVTFSDGSTATFTNIENVVIPCFTPGSLVATPNGSKLVEDIQIGDLVETRDSGPQTVRWVGQKTLSVDDLARAPHLCPILLQKDSIAPSVPDRDMTVSPQHRMLIENSATQLWLGEDEVLVKAKDMVRKPGIDQITPEDSVTYIHIMFDQHEILLVDNAWTESFQPGDVVLGHDQDGDFAELLELFPDLATSQGRKCYKAARPSAKAFEAQIII